MQKLILGLSFALLVCLFGSVSAAAARGLWHHGGPGPAGAGASGKVQKSKTPHDKPSRSKNAPLHASPKSVGWWHHSPGPMGAGAK